MKELVFADIKVGDTASLDKTVTEKDIANFAEVSGDFNPIHVDPEFASQSMFKQQIAHGMLSASYISALLGNTLPGPNTLYLGQTLNFKKPVLIGDTVTVTVTVTEKRDDKRILKLDTTVTNQHGEVVVEGGSVMKKVGL